MAEGGPWTKTLTTQILKAWEQVGLDTLVRSRRNSSTWRVSRTPWWLQRMRIDDRPRLGYSKVKLK